jgi:hypothetical protein
MIIATLSFILGFVSGALVFRNNSSKGEAVVKAAEAKAKEIQDQIRK